MHIFKFIASFLVLTAFIGCQNRDDVSRSSRKDFNSGWRFALIDNDSVAAPGYDDSDWRKLNLPHDWAIEGDFSESNPSGTGGGALPGGIGWYRKDFIVPDSDKGKQIYIDFDGAYMNASVYVNGNYLGTRPYGYASFSYDITPYVKYGEENVIAVKVDNAEQPNSRWYSGCGIYRNVWMRVLDPIHVAQWGQAVIATVSGDTGTLDITTEIENNSGGNAAITISSNLIAPDGKKVAESPAQTLELTDSITTVESKIALKNPKLWSTDTPDRYTLVTVIKDAASGKTLDTYSTVTGFRTFEFDAEKGFSLNGKPMKINGVCLHHDAGALGAVVNRRAIERQLEIMKEMGVNAIRSSHNPPAPELLELCDSMGLMVMDETFDMWRKKKTAHDYSRYFDEWHERDLVDLVKRDRNHPSVFMWSIGNEVLEQWSDAKADTLSLEQANLILNFGHSKEMLAEEGEMSVNSLLTKKLADMTRHYDPSRPITAGCNESNPGNHLFRSGALDVIGFNYHENDIKNVPVNFPGKPFIMTESVSGLMTRGYYRMPSDSMYIWPKRWDIPFFDESFSCSSYDNCHVPWGNPHEQSMRNVMENDFVMGQFVWTGFDYLGEPTPYGWPARSSYFGIVDLAGFPKDVYYMYQSQWRPDKTVLHLFPHWNWEDGQEIDMWAYHNNADEVELFVNGESQGVRHPEPGKYHSSWRVTYHPGSVSVVSRKDGKEVARQEIKTAAAPAAIRLTPDRSVITADGKDLCYVTAEIVDKDGNLCPNADNEITFTVNGAGANVGVDNGSPTSLERFKADHRKAFYGKALLIVQNDGNTGDITIEATSPGLTEAKSIVKTKH